MLWLIAYFVGAHQIFIKDIFYICGETTNT